MYHPDHSTSFPLFITYEKDDSVVVDFFTGEVIDKTDERYLHNAEWLASPEELDLFFLSRANEPYYPPWRPCPICGDLGNHHHIATHKHSGRVAFVCNACWVLLDVQLLTKNDLPNYEEML